MARRRVFLGAAVVVPRKDFKRDVERLSFRLDTDVVLQRHLAATFQLPLPPPLEEATAHDYVMDLTVVQHQLGEASQLSLGAVGLPLLWRPRVEIRSHIRALASGRTELELSARRRMPWGEFLRCALSPSTVLWQRDTLLREGLTRLLDEAVLDVLGQAAARLK